MQQRKKCAVNAGAHGTAVSDEDGEEFDDSVENIVDIEDYELPPVEDIIQTQCVDDETLPRLIIHSIELENFKSYGGRQVLGPFHDRFSCIIGPNGSGKSNIIDSMLFVFGYRAQKIRGKKLSALIHNVGDHGRRDSAETKANQCRVAINFELIKQNPDSNFQNYDIVEKTVIARTAYASGNSHYTIDGRESRFTEVQSKLKSYGVDLIHNRFLILQGEVEQIALMKPKGQTETETGLVEFLESIIGTHRYIKPQGLAQERYEQYAEQRMGKLNRVKIAESDCKSLESDYELALSFMRKENEINTIVKRINERSIEEINVQLSEKTNVVQELKQEFDKINTKVYELQTEYSELQNDTGKMKSELAKEHKSNILAVFTKNGSLIFINSVIECVFVNRDKGRKWNSFMRTIFIKSFVSD